MKLRLFAALPAAIVLMMTLSGCDCQHQWQEANCVDPKICTICYQTQGKPNDDHRWKEATTDAPETCSVCGLTRGEIIDTDERFHTEDCQSLFGKWTTTYELGGEIYGLDQLNMTIRLTMVFSNDGTLTISRALSDPDAFRDSYSQYLAQMMYDRYAQQGMNEASADLACQTQYGKTIMEFCREQALRMTVSMTSSYEKVYYVSNEKLYTGEDWDSDMTSQEFQLENGTVTLKVDDLEEPQKFRRTAN